jgi:hypothetical protein
MTSPATAARAVLASVALACGSAALAACGSSGGPAASSAGTTTTVTATPSATGGTGGTPPPATGSTSSPPAAGPAGCATSGLAVKLGAGSGAAGSSYIPIVFTNTSGSTCSLFGYPGVSFVTGANGSQIGSAAMRDAAQPARSIVLAPGAAAHATLRIVDALNFTPAPCQLTTAHTLKIFPPDQTAPLYLSYTSKTCASTAPAYQVLFIQTVGSGTGG